MRQRDLNGYFNVPQKEGNKVCDGRKSRGGSLTENGCHEANVTDPP